MLSFCAWSGQKRVNVGKVGRAGKRRRGKVEHRVFYLSKHLFIQRVRAWSAKGQKETTEQSEEQILLH